MAAYGATLLRLILGIVYIMHAYLAAVVFGPAGMITYQTKNGVPFAEIGTWYLILAHGLGGICLVLGLFTRWAALANVPVMLGAVVFVHLKNGFWAHSNPKRLRVRAGPAGRLPRGGDDRRRRARPQAVARTGRTTGSVRR